MARKITEAHDDKLGKGKALDLGEIGEGEPIECVTEKDFTRAVELEVFMNDILTVIVHQSTEEGALDFAPPQVNGLNQPILRGAESKVKRKYIEALARCRTTKYVQQVIDSSKPENIQMVERTQLTYPFAVLDDPNPNGKQWLDSILAQG